MNFRLEVNELKLLKSLCVFQAQLTVEESVSGLLTVLSHLTDNDHGGFKDYRGNNIPW